MSIQVARKSGPMGGVGAHSSVRLRHSASTEAGPLRQNAEDRPVTLAAVTPCVSPTVAELRELVERHLPLVGVLVSERLRNVPTHIRRDDLMSAGMLALVLSAGAYDPQRGVPFRSFAAFRIRGAVIDELRAMDWTSRSVRSRVREVEAVRTQLTTTLDRPPSTRDIAGALGIPIAEIDAAYADLERGNLLSLQGVATDALLDLSGADCPELLLLRREMMGYLYDAIAALPERLRFVVMAHYFGQRPMVDIAIEMCVSQSRVSQMCTEATTLIRDGMNSQLDPDALRPLAQTGRAADARHAYYRALADRSTVRGRLDMSTRQGDMRQDVHAQQIEKAQRVKIA